MGLDGRALAGEVPLLMRDGEPVEEMATADALVEALAERGARLVILGPDLPDQTIAEVIQKVRSLPEIREVSILVLVPATAGISDEVEAFAAGANEVLRQPLDRGSLESAMARLLSVPRRVEARIPVHGQVVGTPKTPTGGHFYGLTRNLSAHGLLLASPIHLPGNPDLDLEFHIPQGPRIRALGRVVREAPEVGWPYRGYGVEFLFVPPEDLERIAELVTSASVPARGTEQAIHATIRRGAWIYEIAPPLPRGSRYEVEIRRASRHSWKPGLASRLHVVDGSSPEGALRAARTFVEAQP